MAEVVRKDVDNLNSVLTITFNQEDYQPKVNAELSKYRKKAHMKGFRKGKTPMGFIKKMYGKGIMAEVINEMLQDAVTKFLQEEEIEILGQPLPSKDQSEFDFDINTPETFIFNFDLGIAPSFEIKGLESKASFEKMVVDIPEDKINEQLSDLQKRAGERVSVDEKIEGNDLVTFNAEELVDGKVKKDGWATTFNILADSLEESIKEKVIGKKKGEKLTFNIYTIEGERTEEYVRKHLLKVEENDTETEIGEEFEGVVEDVQRIAPADLDKDFFDKVFGEGNVNTATEAKAKIEEQIAKQYENQADSLLFRDIQEKLIEQNPMELPEAFLKRWIKATNENATEEMIEKDFDGFKENLKWSLIRSKAVKNYDISITEDQIVEAFKDRIRSYFGGYGDELVILNTANRMMQDQKQVDQVYQELIAERLFESIKETVTLKDKKVSAEELEESIMKARQEAMKESATETDQATAEEVTEDVEQ